MEALATMYLRRVQVVGRKFAEALTPAHAANNWSEMRWKKAPRHVQQERINYQTREACACSINSSTTEWSTYINHRTRNGVS
jgi:hypothetical protein